MELWKTLDYWEIRELLALKHESARSPDIKLQEIKNQEFNKLLDNIANKSLEWHGIEQKKTVRGVKKFSFNFYTSDNILENVNIKDEEAPITNSNGSSSSD